MEDASPEMLSIFAGAIERPSPEERAAFLDTACGADVELRRRIEALVRAHDEAGGFLRDRPVARDPAATVAQPAGESPGSVIGPYRLLEQIGEGGFGVVFLAEQKQPVRRKVALKVIKPGMDTKQVVARFEAERQALALMDHPNIARVLDGGATPSGRPYFVMELVKGAPVTEFCDRHHLPPRQRLELFVSVCRAVQHAHQKGVIHRDLKPTNVLVTVHDTVPVVKVIDFGIAKAFGQELTDKTLFTGFAQLVGTPLYMSPEQAGQRGIDIDTRSDVYSLGVLLYELLTGTTPFTAERFREAAYDEIRRIIREEEPPRPSTRLCESGDTLRSVAALRHTEPAKLTRLLRGELDWVVMKALEKDRNRRYESPGALAADVRRYLDDEPVQACPPSLGYRLRKLARRNKGPVLAAAVVAVALVVGIIGTTWGMFRATRAEADAVNEANEKEVALKDREAALKDREAALTDAREQLFLALENRARAERSSGRVGQRFEALKTIRQAARIRVTPGLRTEAIAALVVPDVEVVHEWEGWPDDAIGLDFDAEFTSYARLDKQGRLTVCRLSGGREEVIHRLPAHGKPPFGGVLMSPDGRFAAYSHSWERSSVHAGVCLWKVNGPVPAALPLDGPTDLHEAAWAFSSNSRRLAIGHADRSVSVYDLETDARVRRLAVAAAPLHLAFHPRERRLAVACGKVVQVFDTDTGHVMAALRHSAAVTWTYCVAWHPDGRRLATGCNDRRIHVWDSDTGSEVMPPWYCGDDGITVSYNAAGDRLASVGWGNQTWLWDAGSGRLLLKMPGSFGVRFSRDGRLLGHGIRGTRIRLSRVASGRELRVLRGLGADGPQVSHPVVHTDDRTLAAASIRGLQFFDLITGEMLASVRLPHIQTDMPVFFDGPRPPPGREGKEAGGWVTGGQSGLLLWPARPDPARPGALRVGPPQPLAPGLKSRFTEGASASRDGRIVAVPDGRFTTVIDRDRPGHRLTLGPQYDLRFTAVSPDGRWVVTGSHWEGPRSPSARIWDARSGKPLGKLPLEGSTPSRFSPDGRWLMTSSRGGCRLWEAGTWREVRRFDTAQFAFGPDSRLLAIGDVFGVIRLVETATGREMARLTGPELIGYQPVCFTGDGTRLIASGAAATPLCVWDLRSIREQLKEMGLDWEWPEFPRAGPAVETRPRGAVIVTGPLDVEQQRK